MSASDINSDAIRDGKIFEPQEDSSMGIEEGQLSKDNDRASSVCYMCYNTCGIRVRRENGTAVEIEGDPGNPYNRRRLCAKGKAGIMSLYDPYRIKAPLKRTNREKGIGIDPGWVEVGWEEALDILVDKLSKVKREDPRKLVIAGLDFHSYVRCWAFASAFGTPNNWLGAADYYCGNGHHSVLYMTNASFFAEPDLDHCNYCILFGAQLGFMVASNATPVALKMADARARGMKVVVIDPICTNAAAKANQWIPIRPGTDAALALAMLNILVNELSIYDAGFLRKHTNGPYLVGPDGYYLREAERGRPLIWDLTEGRPKPFNSPDVEEAALEGSYLIDEREYKPAFQVLKEHLRRYSAAEASKITTVPPETIMQMAREFGEAARLGSKIVVDGEELPFRPVCALWGKGAINHGNAILTGMAVQLLNVVVGAMDVPGGHLGVNPRGPFWGPGMGPEGLIIPAQLHLVVGGAYPAREVRPPERLDAFELFPVVTFPAPFFEEGVLNSPGYRISYDPEVMINFNSNPMMTSSNPRRIAQVLERIPFIATFAFHLDETSEFADLVLPAAHYMERFDPLVNHPNHWILPGPGEWYWMTRQPVVKASGGIRQWADVLLELAERLGMQRDYHVALNTALNLKKDYRLVPDRKYSWEEIAELWIKSWLGPDSGLGSFKTEAVVISGKKRVEEAYPRPFLEARIPVYLEHFKTAGQEVKKVTEQLAIPWDVSGYQPLPDWKPCPGFETGSQKEFFAVNYKTPFHTFSFTPQNPWLDDLSQHHPYVYTVIINSESAKKNGISDGDIVWVESDSGRQRGKAKVTEGIHPEAIGIAGTFGHWAKGLPVARGKGIHFNSLFPIDSLGLVDRVSGAQDCCIKVKIYKA